MPRATAARSALKLVPPSSKKFAVRSTSALITIMLQYERSHNDELQSENELCGAKAHTVKLGGERLGPVVRKLRTNDRQISA